MKFPVEQANQGLSAGDASLHGSMQPPPFEEPKPATADATERGLAALHPAGGPLRLALVGAGYMADIHVLALRALRGVKVVAVCDPVRARAERLARRAGRSARVETSVDELLEHGGFDAAHVVVPPPLHGTVTEPLLAAGVHCLVEKPLAVSREEAGRLVALAEEQGVVLAVGHNLVHHECVARLAREVESGRLGRLEHLSLLHWVPLRQLATGDVDHFMFSSEAAILFEQAVHPLSIVVRFLGEVLDVTTRVEEPVDLPDGTRFFDTWRVALRCERGTADLSLSFGRRMTETTVTAIGTDGVVRTDLQRATYHRLRKTPWLEAVDSAWNTAVGGLAMTARAGRTLCRYAAGLFGLTKLPDAYLASVARGIGSFHDAVRGDSVAVCDGHQGEAVVAACERIADAAGVSRAWRREQPLPQPGPPRPGEVVVTGATGFLGRHLVGELLRAGRPVTLVVRRPRKLAPSLWDRGIRVFQGDATDAKVMARAVRGAARVVHMATCMGEDGESAEETMRAGVRAVGEACLGAAVERLVFVSSIAALWLGEERPVDGEVGPDPRPSRRAAYARGKIAAEQEIARLRERGLETVVLRPSIVLGRGGTLEHGGFGLWPRDNQCLAWGSARRPRPLVLARDVARAIVAALEAPAVAGKTYNLAGPVRLSAAEYCAELARRSGRDVQVRPQPTWAMFAVEVGKWCVKLAAGRRAPFPSYRDLRSRAMLADLDCRDAERDLGWRPESDRQRFLEEAFADVSRARG